MQKYMPSSQFNCYLIIITITIVDRKSTRLNSSHLGISYAVFCLKKKSTRLNSSHLGISYAVFCLKNKNRERHHKPENTCDVWRSVNLLKHGQYQEHNSTTERDM